ncbi:putative glycosyl hydrolase [Porphyridium purpureum]|uniref:Putative glycosyl hydrolase n=1 Tax=Porphyridium purpureum TaxID=35688 RepID=A0A5J4Z2I0_PORPP|nr:putative glycosyl hydrolase [Porphyridium purpureum]|eukprot:POR1297..scf295_1
MMMGSSEAHDELAVDGEFFRDARGCARLFRGMNLSGISKLPKHPEVTTYESNLELFFDHRRVNFVGRPLELEEADVHLHRLRSWGFNYLRFVIIWEAIEHEAPGVYDHAYIEYVVQMLHKVKAHGFKCFVDPHQDVWSRFTGGSGAPGWTLEIVGFEVRNLVAAEAAVVHNQSKIYPRMCWSTNLFRLACATMFTLFFAGDEFAPDARAPDGRSFQQYLQDHYINAVGALVQQIVQAGLHDDVVLGYDTLNEPSCGYVGVRDLAGFHAKQAYRVGPTPSLFQGMLLGEGIEQSCTVYQTEWYGRFTKGKMQLNASNVRAWSDGRSCIWAQHGVWDAQTRTLLKPNYFSVFQRESAKKGQPVDFHADFWLPFAHRFARALRIFHPRAIMFLEPEPFEMPPIYSPDEETKGHEQRIVYCPHWYDGATLAAKRWLPFNADLTKIAHHSANVLDFVLFRAFGVGSFGIRRVFAQSMAYLKATGLQRIGNHPCMIGEIGIPYDLRNNGEGFRRNDYSVQTVQIDAHMNAMESSLLNFCWWTYVPSNTYEHGDHWCGEDLSVCSSSHGEPGRALKALARPVPLVTAGSPRSWSFNIKRSTLHYAYKTDASFGGCQTQIQLPSVHFPDRQALRVSVSVEPASMLKLTHGVEFAEDPASSSASPMLILTVSHPRTDVQGQNETRNRKQTENQASDHQATVSIVVSAR